MRAHIPHVVYANVENLCKISAFSAYSAPAWPTLISTVYIHPGGVDGCPAGVSILTSYGEKPHYVKLPIFSEFMEKSAKFMKNSGLTKWTQNLR